MSPVKSPITNVMTFDGGLAHHVVIVMSPMDQGSRHIQAAMPNEIGISFSIGRFHIPSPRIYKVNRDIKLWVQTARNRQTSAFFFA